MNQPDNRCLIVNLDGTGTTTLAEPSAAPPPGGWTPARPLQQFSDLCEGLILDYTNGAGQPWACASYDPCLDGWTLWGIEPCSTYADSLPDKEPAETMSPNPSPPALLPATGVDTDGLAAVALSLVLAGAVVLRLARRALS